MHSFMKRIGVNYNIGISYQKNQDLGPDNDGIHL